MSRKIVCGLSFLILGIASGCTEKELTVEPVPFHPRSLITPPSASGALDIGSFTDPANSMPLPSYDYEVIVQLRIDGVISTVARADTYLQAYSGDLDGSGIYVESAFSSCYASVTFRFSVEGTMGPGPCLYTPAPRSSWADTSLVQGTASVTRGHGIPQFTQDCNYNPCHSYSGSQTVSVTPLTATLQLAASATQVDSGQTVVFTASVTPSSIKGIQVPLKILTWRWLPSGGGTGLTTACTSPVNPCSAVIRESGAMELTALANGAEQVDSASVVINGGQVKIVPDSATMKFSIFVPDTGTYVYRNFHNTQKLTVSVVRPDGTPIPNRVVTLDLAATEGTAGHLHASPNTPKPAGFLNGGAMVQVNTGPTGFIHTVTFEAPEPSGPVTIRGTSPSATPGSATVDVKIALSPYSPGPGYKLIGDTAHSGQHPANHYATPEHIARLQQLALMYYGVFGSGLEYNDSSLQFGGLFDYNWEHTPWQLPHAGHREGLHTDLRTETLTRKQMREVTRLWQDSLSGKVHQEEDHYHLVYPKPTN
jgi:hypothetical protein